MKPIITLCLAMPLMVLSLESKAQQLTPTEAARAAAPKRAAGPFPPQPYHSSRSGFPAAAQPPAPTNAAVRTDKPHVADVTQADQAPQFNKFDSGGHYLGAQEPDKTEYGQLLEARSRKIFPLNTQEAERQQWMPDQEQRAIANDINRSKALLYPASGR
jgi:hypothetical protein